MKFKWRSDEVSFRKKVPWTNSRFLTLPAFSEFPNWRSSMPEKDLNNSVTLLSTDIFTTRYFHRKENSIRAWACCVGHKKQLRNNTSYQRHRQNYVIYNSDMCFKQPR
jgi:hypothetical protein